MTFPFVTVTTAGILLIIQMLLAVTVSGARKQTKTSVGDGGNEDLLRKTRRHGNLAENAAIFIIGFLLVELSNFDKTTLTAICAAFIFARISHSIGLSLSNPNNVFRLVGGAGTYLIGFGLGGLLVWIGATAAIANHTLG